MTEPLRPRPKYVIGPDGSPLKVRDQKGKDVKYQILARDGYTAKHTVE